MIATSTSSPASQPDRTSTQPSSSPFESPSSSASSLSGLRVPSPKALHMIDITYPESYMRTPLPVLPFSAPKWLLDYGRSAGFAGFPERDCIVEFEDEDDNDEADIVRESIEPRDENVPITKAGGVWGDGKREWIEYTNVNVPSTSYRKRRFDSTSSDIDITSSAHPHPSQKLKRSKP